MGRSERSSNTVSAWLVAILLVLVAAVLYQMSGGILSSLLDLNAEPRAVTARGELAADEQSTIEIYKNARDSVVHITTIAVSKDQVTLDLLEIPQGSGSGFLWDENGYVVTNFHVIQAAREGGLIVRVTLADGTSLDARYVGAAPDKDLAVLKIDAPSMALKKIAVGESSSLEVGQKVFAIGNPFGLDQTLTTGVISGVGRAIQSVTGREIHGVIQTDAAINPGNSGGPLLDSAGRLIGINTAIASETGNYAGIGFAVPVDTVNRIVPELIKYGDVERPGLGINIFEQAIVEKIIRQGDLPRRGVLVQNVVPNGSADQAGIRPSMRDRFGNVRLGDLIIAVDGTNIENAQDLFDTLEGSQVGDTVTVTVFRVNAEINLQVTLQALPF